jgi:cytochrome c-type biogenesis protein CcsB
MKKFSAFLFSMLFTGILLVIFAISIGYATFIENDYGTVTAKILIYNALWFEALLILMGINLIGSLFINKLFKRNKWPVLLFHIAFIFILIGAAITRYLGYEGIMHIREGESTDYIISEETYIQMVVNDGDETAGEVKQVMFSPYTANRFSESMKVNGKTVHFNNLQYIPSAMETIVADPEGEPVLSIVLMGRGMNRSVVNLREGEKKKLDGFSLGFNAAGDIADVNLALTGNSVFVAAPDTVYVLDMEGQNTQFILPGIQTEINTQTVYRAGNVHFAVNRFFQKGRVQIGYSSAPGAQLNDAVQLDVTADGIKRSLVAYGKKGALGELYSTSVNGIDVSFSYGSQKIGLPFSVYLKDFQLERYPGSNSPSSFASEVVLRDEGFEKPFRIFMNNILKYEGYRFFQSSYDTDEKGTVLSVNSDSMGTSITYFGYFLMMLGFVFTLFVRNSRFTKLLKASAKLRDDRKKLFAVIVLGLMISAVNAQTTQGIQALNSSHVSEFEELLLQSHKGRVEPAATLASEIMRKVAKKNKWEGMSPSEVFLHMQANPDKWMSVPLIKVANADLRKTLGIKSDYASFNDIVLPHEMGGYKLGTLASEAFARKSNERTKLDKEIINVDERVNILFNVFSGHYLTVFPVPGDSNNKWVALNEADRLGSEGHEFAKQVVGNYYAAVAGTDWITASQLLARLKSYQRQEGNQIIPSDTKIRLEVLYHKADVFSRLSKILLSIGLIMLFVQLYTILKPKVKLERVKKVAFILIISLFLVQTAGLVVRWYISGHAPWSNGYESMIFLSWATLLAGLMLVRRSEITLSLTALLAGLTLLVAGFSWMSPEITNLVPVLKSYWLIVHVAIIMASYGFLAITAMLGLLNLVLMILRNRKNEIRVNHTIKELVVIIHISLIVGVFLLAAGSFLGGIWANESWGRYWGWDPKETWAMVTIVVYSFIVHMHKIPGFRGNYAVSAASLIGFGSVLMTYFGVNYYLSGLHSYAQGEPAPVPSGVYIGVVLVLLLATVAFVSDKNAKQDEVVIP